MQSMMKSIHNILGPIHKQTLTGRFMAKNFTSLAEQNQQIAEFSHRTDESDPRNHGTNHEARFYVISKETFDKMYSAFGFSEKQKQMFGIFREHAFMIRHPALEVMDYLKRADYSRFINKYILYGRWGSGRTFTLNHIIHYGVKSEFIIVHSSDHFKMMVSLTDVTTFRHVKSDYKEGRVDHPINAAVWLKQFKNQNAGLLSKLNLKSSKKYIWSIREITEKDDPLIDIVDHGINRTKHAADCMAVILKELKIAANEGNCKILVAIDKVNEFFLRSKLRYADRSFVDMEDITYIRSLKKMLLMDWRNGAIVATVDAGQDLDDSRNRNTNYKNETYLPFQLLGDMGRDVLDPFIPIKVDLYNEKELESCLAYYFDRNWLLQSASHTQDGIAEIKFLSANNPLEFYKISRSR